VRSLITGVGGFAGQHLARLLLEESEDQVFGVARDDVAWNNGGVLEAARFELLKADLSDAGSVREAFEAARPDRVYLLAAMSSTAAGFGDPLPTIINNVACVVNPLEAVRAVVPDARILLVSSAEVYGSSPGDGGLVDESCPLRPENPYALSKATQDLLGYQYGCAYGLDVVRVRSFNHTGPGQTDRFAAPTFARQIAEIEIGAREPIIEVGNLSAIRDFTDVRDVVRGYQLALDRGERGAAYNLASGRGIEIRSLLDHLTALSKVPVTVKLDPARMRPSDAPALIGDARLFRQRTGWEPGVPIEQTLEDLLDYWRQRVQAA